MLQGVVGSAHTGGGMCRGRESKGKRGYGRKGIKRCCSLVNKADQYWLSPTLITVCLISWSDHVLKVCCRIPLWEGCKEQAPAAAVLCEWIWSSWSQMWVWAPLACDATHCSQWHLCATLGSVRGGLVPTTVAEQRAGSVPTAGGTVGQSPGVPPGQVCLGVLIANPRQDQPPSRAPGGGLEGPGCGQGCWLDRGALLLPGGCVKARVCSRQWPPVSTSCRGGGLLAAWFVFWEGVEGSTLSLAARVTSPVSSLDVCAALPVPEPATGKEQPHPLGWAQTSVPMQWAGHSDQDRVLGWRCWKWLLLPIALNKAFLSKGKLGEQSWWGVSCLFFKQWKAKVCINN